MKKFLFSLFALLAVMTVSAQTLGGSWQSIEPEVKNLKNGTHTIFAGTYTFNEDGTFASAADYTVSTKPRQTKEMEAAFVATIKGTYKFDGDKLVLNYDAKSLKLDMVSMSVNGKVVNSSDMKARFNRTYNIEDVKASAAKEFKNNTYIVQPNVDGSMLQLTDVNDGKIQMLMRIVTLKN